jgi:hypothetical protein
LDQSVNNTKRVVNIECDNCNSPINSQEIISTLTGITNDMPQPEENKVADSSESSFGLDSTEVGIKYIPCVLVGRTLGDKRCLSEQVFQILLRWYCPFRISKSFVPDFYVQIFLGKSGLGLGQSIRLIDKW